MLHRRYHSHRSHRRRRCSLYRLSHIGHYHHGVHLQVQVRQHHHHHCACRQVVFVTDYLRQVNEVNGGDNVFVRCVCVCLSVRSGRSWELNANSSKMVTATDFKFDTHVPRDSPERNPKNFIQKGAWPRSRDPLNFWALNANSSKTVKATDFKFDIHVSSESSDMTPKNVFKRGRDHGHVTP